MPVLVKITRKGLIPNMSKSQIKRLMMVGMWTIANGWHERYRPIHFTHKGARRYNYRRRKSKDVRTGRIKIKHGKVPPKPALPLVWTGRTRGMVKPANIHARYNQSTARYPGANTLNFKPGGINMAKEFKTVLASEERALGKIAEKALRKRFTKGKKNITVR